MNCKVSEIDQEIEGLDFIPYIDVWFKLNVTSIQKKISIDALMGVTTNHDRLYQIEGVRD